MNNTLENLLKQDSEFSEAKFKSKVENTFVQIKLSMVTGKTEKIHHFVNEETYQKIVQKVENDKSNKRIQLYDELNVADVQILKIHIRRQIQPCRKNEQTNIHKTKKLTRYGSS